MDASPPSILYKYLPAERVDVLTGGNIRFSPPRDLNDLNEARPNVRANLGAVMKRLEHLKHDPIAYTQQMVSFAAYVERQGTDALRAEVDAQYGVLSLTTDPVNPQMWERYADNYRGYLIGFDTSHAWLGAGARDEDVTKCVQRVRYTVDPPIVEVGGSENEVRSAFIVGSILTKQEEWAYESEWRMLAHVNDTLRPIPDGASHLVMIPRDAIRQIVLGPRVTEALEKQVREVLTSTRYPHAELRRLLGVDDASMLRVSEPEAHRMPSSA